MEDKINITSKTNGIEKLVTLSEEIEKVLSGKKTAVRRNGRYADSGDLMILKGQKFKVDRVYEQSLGELTDDDANKEGYSNLEEYKKSILAMHPGMPWLPHMKVWVHEFSPVNN